MIETNVIVRKRPPVKDRAQGWVSVWAADKRHSMSAFQLVNSSWLGQDDRTQDDPQGIPIESRRFSHVLPWAHCYKCILLHIATTEWEQIWRQNEEDKFHAHFPVTTIYLRPFKRKRRIFLFIYFRLIFKILKCEKLKLSLFSNKNKTIFNLFCF